MSRVGKMPVAVPQGVDVSVTAEQITVKGTNGTLVRAANALVLGWMREAGMSVHMDALGTIGEPEVHPVWTRGDRLPQRGQRGRGVAGLDQARLADDA